MRLVDTTVFLAVSSRDSGVRVAHATRFLNSSYDPALVMARFFMSSTARYSRSRATALASSASSAARSRPSMVVLVEAGLRR